MANYKTRRHLEPSKRSLTSMILRGVFDFSCNFYLFINHRKWSFI